MRRIVSILSTCGVRQRETYLIPAFLSWISFHLWERPIKIGDLLQKGFSNLNNYCGTRCNLFRNAEMNLYATILFGIIFFGSYPDGIS